MENIETPNETDISRWQTVKRGCMSPWYKYITVEPSLFLFTLAFMITSVVEQDFVIYKACRVNNNFTEEICRNIKSPEFAAYKERVQITTAKFWAMDNVCGQTSTIILALFLGSFSDRRGRKLPLLIGLAGKFIFCVMIVVNTIMTTWPLEYIIVTATIPTALAGADVAVYSSCYSYITDVSTVDSRTLRVIILDATFSLAMPTGIALGSYLFYNVLQRSYTYMFIVNATLLMLSFLYSLFALKWQTNSKQRPIAEVGWCGIFGDFFDRQHVKDSFHVLKRKRSHNHRAMLIIFLLMMALYSFQREENQYLYVFTAFKFKWDVNVFSHFKTLMVSLYAIVLLIVVPIMNKCLKWKDMTLIVIGVWSHIFARFFYYFGNTETFLYIGGVVCGLGPIVGPMIRAMTSKIIPQSERGKVFAILSASESGVSFLSSITYSLIYRLTLPDNGNGIFLLTIATQLIVFLLILYVHRVRNEEELEPPDMTEKLNDDSQMNSKQTETTNL